MRQSINNLREGDYGIIRKLLQNLPKSDKVYRNKKELEEDIKNLFNDDMKNSETPKYITECTIITDKRFRRTVEDHLEDQRVKRKHELSQIGKTELSQTTQEKSR